MLTKKTLLTLALCAGAVVLSGCYKISFTNGGPAPASYREGEWHHNGVAGLVEFSPPVEMSARCNGQNWAAVKTHMTFIQGLVSGITYSLYNPWNVEYSCR